MNGSLALGRHARRARSSSGRRARAGSGTDPCRGTSSGRRARRPRRSRAGTRSRRARRSSGTPTPASAGRRPSPCTTGTNVPRSASSLNSSNDVIFIAARTPQAASSAASRMTPVGGRTPVHHSNCSSACATSMSRPPIVRHPARRGVAQQPRRRAGCRPGRRRAARRADRRRQRRLVDVRVHADRRAVDQQVPAARRRRPRRRPRAASSAATSRGLRRSRACTRDRRRRADASATATARAAPPAPSTVARAPVQRHRGSRSGAQEAGDVGVAAQPRRAVDARSVLTAPMRRATGVALVDALEQRRP